MVAQSSVPAHIAVIMDGNGRWAKQRGLERSAGHRAGMKSVRELVEQCCQLGVRHLTLFSFSTENWSRSWDEVSSLMSLFQEYLESELANPELLRSGVRLRTVGDIGRLSLPIRAVLRQVEEKTKENSRLDLILAVSYGGREDIAQAARELATEVKSGRLDPANIDAEMLASRLWTAGIPNPDLLIRTGGETRISNFLLWQLAYTELVFRDEFWPDFSPAVLAECLSDFQHRERRFGKTSEQLRT